MSVPNQIEAELTLFATADGGKKAGIAQGYRSLLLVFPEWEETWSDPKGRHVCIGAVVRLLDRDTLDPGETAIVRFCFWDADGLRDIDASPGVTFRLAEGHRFVGEATIVRSFTEAWRAADF